MMIDVREREEEVSKQHYATIRIVVVECESSPIDDDVPMLVAVYVVQTAAFLERRCGFNLDRLYYGKNGADRQKQTREDQEEERRCC